MRNTLAPVNRIPPEVLSLIPHHLDGGDRDQCLVPLTHVCRDWRNTFISHPSLWTRLDFTNVEKTRTYIKRSHSFPLNICLQKADRATYLDDAFSLVIPHICRLESLAINAQVLSSVLKHFRCRVPLLERLDIEIGGIENALDSAHFNGDLSSLRELHLCGITAPLPWKTLKNLRVVDLTYCPPMDSVAQLLDFFESAPLLNAVKLQVPLPSSSDAPPRRTVALPHLTALNINTSAPHSVLLNHLHIPIGASLTLSFGFGEGFSRGSSPLIDRLLNLLLDYLPSKASNLRNLSCITAIDLLFNPTQKFVRLSGPSGSLYILTHWAVSWASPDSLDHQILYCLDSAMLSTIQRLSISKYEDGDPSVVTRALSFTNKLQTLTLIRCTNLPFISALNPGEDPSNPPLCPNLEMLVFHIKQWDQFYVRYLIRMVKNRASRGVRLRSIMIVGPGGLMSEKEVLELREHVTYVEYKVSYREPPWDGIHSASDQSQWGYVCHGTKVIW